MLDENDILRVIKQAAYDANQAAYPAEILTGKVLSVAPLEIMVEQKLTLTKKQLIIAREVTDYTVMTEIKGESYQVTVKKALQKGDEVILLKMQGGQKYVIIDKVVK